MYLRKMAKRLSKSTANGPTGMANHIIQGIFEQDGAAADHLTKICNRIAACAYSDDVRELLLIGLGVCLPKPDSDSLRPIVIGEALMRFIGSCTMNALKKKVTDYFGNLQLGVGVANGVETIVHAIRAMLELNPDLVLVCGDADNAFNNFTREQLFEEVRKHFPGALPYIKFVYGIASKVAFATGPTSSSYVQCSMGVKQGRSEGSFCYSLALHPILKEMQEKFPGCWIVAYIDDVFIIGLPDEAATAFAYYRKRYGEIMVGNLNTSKSFVYATTARPSDLLKAGFPKDIQYRSPLCRNVDHRGVRVLGAPISACKLFTSAFVGKTLKQAAAVIETTKSFRSVQHMVSLVTQSLVHKAAFLQRVVPPAQSMQAVTNEWDRTLKSVMEKIIQPHLIPDTSWDQAQLPIEKSGLGLLTWEYWGTINFVCSYASAMPRIAELFPNISCHISNDNSLPPTHEVFRRSRKDLLATFPRLEAAWLQGEKNYRT
jgi:hypothetical protein